MHTTVRSEKGMALVMALGAIVIIGVLIGGIVFVSTQDTRIGSNTMRATRAAAAAELGLNRIRQDWNLADNNRMAVGDTLKKTYTAPRGANVNVIITKVDGQFFWVVAEGTAGALGSQATARRRYGALFRLDTPDIPFMGALTGRGHVTVTGNATVSGKDSVPSGWTGCPPKKDIAGITAVDTSTAGIPACTAGKTCVDGNPKYVQTPLAGDTATYFVYGNATYQSLAATANIVVPAGATLTGIGPVVASGVCSIAVSTNWGDQTRAAPAPAGKCESYFPIIHALGDVHITTGQGQGILLVDGDFYITGNFIFTGAVIVRGSLKMTGTGNHITGAVMAANIDVDDNSLLLGNSSIRYSSCALDAVMDGTAYPKPVKQRAWVDVY